MALSPAQRSCLLLLALLAASMSPASCSSGRSLMASAAAEQQASCCQQLKEIGFSSNLPVVIMDTAGAALSQEASIPVQLCTCSPARSFRDYQGLAEVKIRGSTSATFVKKSFAVDLKRSNGTRNSFSFLGMPKDYEWILSGADQTDVTLGMRNYVTYNLARASGQYASRTVYCEVFLRDDNRPLSNVHYYGIFQGMEKIKQGANRVNVSKLEQPNLTGGYLFVYDNDNIEAGDVLFGPAKGWEYPFQLKYPSRSQATPEMLAWILNYINNFNEALAAHDWLEATPGYTALIDGPSWVDYFLLVETTKNPDGYRGSTYMHKDRDGPLRFGPAWDYDEAYGICCGYPIEGYQRNGKSGPGVSGGSAISPEGYRFNICADQERCKMEPGDGTSRWFRRVWEDPRYRQATATRWAELRAGPWSDAAITSLIQDCVAQIKDAAMRNYAKYKGVLLKSWYNSPEQQWTDEVGNLQSWLLARVAWLDEALAKAASQGAVVKKASSP